MIAALSKQRERQRDRQSAIGRNRAGRDAAQSFNLPFSKVFSSECLFCGSDHDGRSNLSRLLAITQRRLVQLHARQFGLPFNFAFSIQKEPVPDYLLLAMATCCTCDSEPVRTGV